jgi:hypothetical protein
VVAKGVKDNLPFVDYSYSSYSNSYYFQHLQYYSWLVVDGILEVAAFALVVVAYEFEYDEYE